MPVYTLPKMKKPKEGESEMVSAPYEDEYSRMVDIRANKEIIDALEVGGTVEVTLKGTVHSVSMNENASGREDARFSIVLTQVAAYPEGETAAMYEKMAEDDD